MTTYPALHQALTTLVQTIEAGTGHSDGQKIPEQLQRIDELGQQLAPAAPAISGSTRRAGRTGRPTRGAA